jgi:putative CocE/NonD family hydrolase
MRLATRRARVVFTLLVAACMLPGLVVAQRNAPEAAPGPFGVVLHQEDVMVPMRDGVKVAIDIYRPTRDGAVVAEKLPILMQRTPYSKNGAGLVGQAKYFASHGYVVVLADTRGNYKSEGEFSKYYDFDAYDGFDTIEWLAKLPYVQPAVGTWGTSYGAHTQADAAKLNPPALKTMVVNMGGLVNGWDEKVRSGGAFELGQQLGWAFSQLGNETTDPVVKKMLEKEKVEDWFEAMPVRKGLTPLAISPNFEQYVINMITKTDYDDYWKGYGQNWAEHYGTTADIPMLHLTGWYDSYTGGTVANYLALSKLKDSPMKLVVGPWTHGGNTRSFAGQVEFGAEAALTDFAREFHVRWFDHQLKGRKTGAETMPEIRVFVMGTGDGHRDSNGRLFHGGYWRNENAWPLEGTRNVPYYFHGDGSLRTTPPADPNSATTYEFDPHNPVPTIGGSFSGALTSGAFDQRPNDSLPGARPPFLPLKSRPDVVVFQTEPLTEDVEVVGPIEVKMFIASSALDTDFTAKLIDVYPPSADFPTGFEMNLTDDIIRTRYRNSPSKQELMTPGQVYEVAIRPFPTGNVFKKGHRIRIDVSSSNYPRFDINPNTGEPLGTHRRMIPAQNTVQHNAKYPSQVILPIVPSKKGNRTTD